MQGGKLMRTLRPFVGWKGVRRIQNFIYQVGWGAVLNYKNRKRLSKFQ